MAGARRRSWPWLAAALAGVLVVAAFVARPRADGGAAPGGAASRGGGVIPVTGEDPIVDSYVVLLRAEHAATPDAVTAAAHRLTGRYGGRLSHVYPSALRGFGVRIDASRVRRLAADPAVAHVQQSLTVRAADVQTAPPWGLDRIDARQREPADGAYRYTVTGPAATVYVLDTGVRITHRDFQGRARHGWDFVDGDARADDCAGHGTRVAGTAAGAEHGVAKRATVVAVRVLGCDGTGSTADAIAGVDWVLRNATGPAVAVAAFTVGGSDFMLTFAVKTAIDAGTAYVVAAGNESANACDRSPGQLEAVITVAATTQTDARSPYSNYGSCVDVFAPGSGVVSADAGSDTATGTADGTSMAAAHVVGAAALLLEAGPALRPAAVADLIVTRATGGVVSDPQQSPDRLLYVAPDP
jgi:subtilisin family serine protease